MDRNKVADLVVSIMEAIDAIKEETDARDAYEGYEWGYHGQHYKDRSESALERVCEALEEVLK